MKRILVIDEDPAIVDFLSTRFEEDGFEVMGCKDLTNALECFNKYSPDLLLLDVVLTGADGFEICKEIRKFSDTPIIMLTSRGDVYDRIVGLELGADDYLQKPYEPKELLARIKAVLRRCETCKASSADNREATNMPEVIDYPGLRIDKTRYIVTVAGNKIEMPPKELELLFFLAYHPNRVFTREQLLGNVWGYDFFGESRTVDVHIKRIREKVEPLSEKFNWKICTVWGVGYKFEINDDN
ncbi:MAG: response regulator transcription factor [Eubacteriales bacterium]|nr:response regulator transcription factor [Eubacteriales bacterium]MDD4326616.1 response regulator transcription factor [Eubacteriales bacterium]MDD4716546.1 response regulator transcription factor [Eubacteriales bacterium]NCU26777.1 response regulator transcription factor [Candidatus Nomurabacteria bacterium]